MKHIFTIILSFIILIAFSAHTIDPLDITEMVTTLPELNSRALQRDIEIDIGNLPGVEFVETSLNSKTLILNYNSRKLSQDTIEQIINKWGCTPIESSFRNVVALK